MTQSKSSNDFYTFIKINPDTYDGKYDTYFLGVSEYISNIILLTNSLLVIFMTYFLEAGIELPSNGMVGTFINTIENKKHPVTELLDLMPDLKQVNKIVNQTKHSLIGINADPNDQGIVFWVLKTKQMEHLSVQQKQNNFAVINMAIDKTQQKLATLQSKQR